MLPLIQSVKTILKDECSLENISQSDQSVQVWWEHSSCGATVNPDTQFVPVFVFRGGTEIHILMIFMSLTLKVKRDWKLFGGLLTAVSSETMNADEMERVGECNTCGEELQQKPQIQTEAQRAEGANETLSITAWFTSGYCHINQKLIGICFSIARYKKNHTDFYFARW